MVIKDMLIGNKMKVISSSDPSLVSKIGMVVDETRNTLKIREQNGNELIIPKRQTMFEIDMNHNRIKVSGQEIQGTTSERIYKF